MLPNTRLSFWTLLRVPPEKRDKILNILAGYGVVLPLTPRQISTLSKVNINTVRRYLTGPLFKSNFVKKERGLYQITEEGLKQIQYPLCIEERLARLNFIKAKIEKEIDEITNQKEVIHSAWLKVLNEYVIAKFRNIVKQIENCKKRSKNWEEFKILLESSSKNRTRDYQIQHAISVFDKAKKRIPFTIWKKESP